MGRPRDSPCSQHSNPVRPLLPSVFVFVLPKKSPAVRPTPIISRHWTPRNPRQPLATGLLNLDFAIGATGLPRKNPGQPKLSGGKCSRLGFFRAPSFYIYLSLSLSLFHRPARLTPPSPPHRATASRLSPRPGAPAASRRLPPPPPAAPPPPATAGSTSSGSVEAQSFSSQNDKR